MLLRGSVFLNGMLTERMLAKAELRVERQGFELSKGSRLKG